MDNKENLLREFRKKYGRAPRILHIGNIANNAYLNAKFLNEAGFDCDVICNDYYHIMGCPEWEDADFDAASLNHSKPDWTTVDIGGFKRPQWFAQGPQLLCIKYLIAKRTGKTKLARQLWDQLSYTNGTARISPQGPSLSNLFKWNTFPLFSTRFVYLKRRVIGILTFLALRPDAISAVRKKLTSAAHKRRGLKSFGIIWAIIPMAVGVTAAIRLGGKLISHTDNNPATKNIDDKEKNKELWFETVVRNLIEEFAAIFPERKDRLSMEDCAQYVNTAPEWRRLFEHYDLVQAYATEVAYPMLAEKCAYLGFEHGTLRDFTLGDNTISRLTALGYQKAGHVLITNGDCLSYAQRIHVKSYTPMVHPVDDGLIKNVQGDYDGLHAKYGVKFLFICPLRHDWQVKGTDRYIRALPKLVGAIGRDFKLLMTRWGSQLAESMQLAESLGVADLIVWLDPLNRMQLVRYQKSVDIVFDQIALPHFGATAPQAIAATVPVIMSYDPSSTEWIIPEPAPILTAWTEDEIVSAVMSATDQAWLAKYKEKARHWFDKYHSRKVVVEKLSYAYHQVSLRNALI